MKPAFEEIISDTITRLDHVDATSEEYVDALDFFIGELESARDAVEERLRDEND